MDLVDPARGLLRAVPDAGRANPYAGRNIIETIAAEKAFSPFSA
jgi:hypothetical protein